MTSLLDQVRAARQAQGEQSLVDQVRSARAASRQPQQQQSQIGALAREFVSGVAGGSGGDEFVSGARALLGANPNAQGGLDWLQYGDSSLSERYGENLSYTRGKMGEFQDERPFLAGTARVGGAITGAGLAASALPIKAAATTAGRGAQLVGGGLVGGAVEGFTAGEGAQDRLVQAGIGAGVGAVFAPLVGVPLNALTSYAQRKGGQALSAVFRNRRMYNHNSGQLTEAGQKRLIALGFQPDELSEEMQRAFGQVASEAVEQGRDVPASEMARRATANRFDVPLTRGQATGDVMQTAAEEQFRAGVRGRRAMEVMGSFDDVQRAAIEEAREGLGQRVGGEAVDRIDAADAVIEGVRREAEAARLAGRAAYQAVDDMGAALTGESVDRLGERIGNAVRVAGFQVDETTPNAQAALGFLSRSLSDANGSVPFTQIERARQQLVRLRSASMSGSSGADQIAMREVMDSFDSWVDDAITTALNQGDEAVLDQVKSARSLWGKYRSTYLSKEGADRFIQKVVEDDISPDQVASWLYGAATTPGGGQTSLVAARMKDILGADSPEWAMVRRAAWDHITKAPEGQDFGVQRISTNLSKFLDSKGKTLSRELFSPQEIQQMKDFMRLMKNLTPPAKATNPSGSGYEIQRGMTQLMGTIFGASTGGAMGAAAGRQAAASGADWTGTLAAKAAVKGIVRPPNVSGAVGAGVGVGGVAQEQTVR